MPGQQREMNGHRVPPGRRIVGWVYIAVGALVAANAAVCGPHAFEFHWGAVAAMVVAGAALLVTGIWIVRGGWS